MAQRAGWGQACRGRQEGDERVAVETDERDQLDRDGHQVLGHDPAQRRHQKRVAIPSSSSHHHILSCGQTSSVLLDNEQALHTGRERQQ